MRRRVLPLAGSLTTLALALAGAAWAATGGVPVLSDDAGAPRLAAAAATGPLIANDREGVAVLSAAALAPGETRAGEVTIANAGDAAGAVSLTADGAPGSPQLAEVLELAVLDVTGAAPVPVFSGTLAALAQVDLGRLASGDARRLRFEVRFPGGRPAALDDPLQGETATVAFGWTAVATDAATAGGGAIAPTPTATAPGAPSSGGAAKSVRLRVRLTRAPGAVRGGVLVTRLSATAAASARLSGTITVAGATTRLRGAEVRLAPARRTVRIRLPRQALVRGAGRRATVRLTLRASAADGRRATVRRTLRVTLPRHAPAR